jgi:hypothetical protein
MSNRKLEDDEENLKDNNNSKKNNKESTYNKENLNFLKRKKKDEEENQDEYLIKKKKNKESEKIVEFTKKIKVIYYNQMKILDALPDLNELKIALIDCNFLKNDRIYDFHYEIKIENQTYIVPIVSQNDYYEFIIGQEENLKVFDKKNKNEIIEKKITHDFYERIETYYNKKKEEISELEILLYFQHNDDSLIFQKKIRTNFFKSLSKICNMKV